jgi:hypothetical protein
MKRKRGERREERVKEKRVSLHFMMHAHLFIITAVKPTTPPAQ